ncbi:MAG: helix-turn-helix domain-containing protein [Acidobacteriaceae bacterium]|nr:helix-turn-helix domain-containing protein [Acidobacteriaceae bacterium]
MARWCLDVLDVHGIAALLGISVDMVYDLLKSGELPGRKVGRTWRTTRSAVLRWIDESVQAETAQRAFDIGDKAALTEALQSGAGRVKAG